MRGSNWRGTTLFVLVLTVMGLTAGLKLYGIGTQEAGAGNAAASSSSRPTSPSQASSAATPTQTAPGTASTGAPSTASARTLAGDVEQTPYGPLQVRLTLSGATITGVSEVQTPSDGRRSVQINSQAAPVLEQEVLASQSARIDTVSGATYTSESYAKSVQSAIDRR